MAKACPSENHRSDGRDRRGETGLGNEAHVPELRRALLRSAARSHHLPEMRDRLRPRCGVAHAPNQCQRCRSSAQISRPLRAGLVNTSESVNRHRLDESHVLLSSMDYALASACRTSPTSGPLRASFKSSPSPVVPLFGGPEKGPRFARLQGPDFSLPAPPSMAGRGKVPEMGPQFRVLARI